MTTDTTTMVKEMDLVRQFGVSRPELARMRRASLVEGTDWVMSAPPKTVMYTQLGLDRMSGLLSLRASDVPAAPTQSTPPVANNWIPHESIPKIRPNGYILAHGRPAWWGPLEGVVKRSRFINRRAVLLRMDGRDVICRVKNADHYPEGMVIPVRPYDNVFVAARHPGRVGKW